MTTNATISLVLTLTLLLFLSTMVLPSGFIFMAVTLLTTVLIGVMVVKILKDDAAE